MLQKLMPSSELALSAPAVPEAIGRVQELFEILAARNIRYCHWKSNIRLERSLQGKTDFDLLVDRRQGTAFRQILSEMDIKPFHAAPGRDYPAIENYLGFDEATGRLFHLHVHYQLVLGEQFVKNYRLPIEDYFLDLTQIRHGIKIPLPELEIIVLLIRIMLKYGERNLLRDILPYRSTGITAEFRKEIKWLMEQTSVERIDRTLALLSDVIPVDLVKAFLEIAASGRKAGFKLYALRGRLRRTLSLYQRTNPLSALVHYLGERWSRRKFLRSSPVTKMTLPAGGMAVAIIGADGAGKSTQIKSLMQWLTWKVDAHTYYLGSKLPSRRSSVLYSMYRMARRAHNMAPRLLGLKNITGRLQDIILAQHYLSLGRDRYQRYLAGMKRSMAGSVVIFDRYPLESIRSEIGVGQMDGSRISVAFAGNKSASLGSLAKREKKYYEGIRPPENLVILNVSPEVSLKRKPDHKLDVVEGKSKLIDQLVALSESETSGLKVVNLDADLPLEQVSLELRKNIWEML